MNELFFTNFDTAADAITKDIAELIEELSNEHGKVVFAVGGGRTPRLIFPRLARQNLPWCKVTVTLTDERRVPTGHSHSNENLVRAKLLKGNASEAKFESLSDEPMSNSRPDIVYLGFGEDGHVASLFPNGDECGAEHMGVVATGTKSAPYDRLSLTMPTLLSSRHIFIIVSGAGKNRVYECARDKIEGAGLPLAHILRQSFTPVSVYVHR